MPTGRNHIKKKYNDVFREEGHESEDNNRRAML
jgi:hypothetical protein